MSEQRGPGRGSRRRNALSRDQARTVLVIAAVAGVLAVAAGCSPTGVAVADALWTAALVAVTTWAAATTPWWAALLSAVAAASLAATQPALLLIAVAAAVPVAVVGARGASAPAVRSASVGASLVVLLHVDWRPFDPASALVTGAVVVLVLATALPRRHRTVRRSVRQVGLVIVGVVGVALLGGVVALVLAAADAADGQDGLTDGLAALRSGEPATASLALTGAAQDLEDAADTLDAWFAVPARLVPGVGQNIRAAEETARRGAGAASAAGRAAGLIDPSQLELVGGAIDAEAVGFVADPLDDLAVAVDALASIDDDIRSPWLLPTVDDRLDDVSSAAADVAPSIGAADAVVSSLADVVGMNGDRRYLVLFVNPAESRGTGGVPGNWSELTAAEGQVRQTASGRTADLVVGLEENGPLVLDMPDDYLRRFDDAGAVVTGGAVDPGFWSNVTMSPDLPSVGRAVSQMYATATGRAIDGVVVLDPTGIAALLRLTGPLDVPSLDTTLDAGTAERFLTVDQYELPSGEREEVLAELTDAAMAAVTTRVVADPTVIGDALGRAVHEGHVSLWFSDVDEQRMVTLLGADGALPRLDGADGLAVTFDNAAGNKADTFLSTEVVYRPVVDGDTVTATVRVRLRNEAPTSGLPDYVIGNLIDEPAGSNLTLVNVHSPLATTGATLDGEPIGVGTGAEGGWNVVTVAVPLEAGASATVEIRMTARIRSDDYRLVVRPPDLPRATSWRIEATDADGDLLAGFVGTLEERVVLDSRGLTPWSSSFPR